MSQKTQQKLLEFRGSRIKGSPSRPDVVVENMLMEDTWMCMTPDQGRLRYKGPQLVFLWDRNRDTIWLDKRMTKTKDYIVVSWNAMTHKNYLPFENTTENGRNFHAYLPRTINWYQHFGKDEETNPVLSSLKMKESAHIAGRLVSMSLEGIRQLDAFYGNTASHTRQLVPIRKSRSENGDVVMAWCYFTNISTISKYDPHDKVYKLASGITPKRIPTLDIYGGKGEKVFELTRTVIG